MYTWWFLEKMRNKLSSCVLGILGFSRQSLLKCRKMNRNTKQSSMDGPTMQPFTLCYNGQALQSNLKLLGHDIEHTSLHRLAPQQAGIHSIKTSPHGTTSSLHTVIGSARLGFKQSKIGTHSLCSWAAMEMYLAGVPMYTIMLIGRWSSKAFFVLH